MDNKLRSFLLNSNVTEESLRKLELEELVLFEDINSCTQELLKACGITGGQVIRIMTAVSQYGKDLAKKNMNGWTRISPQASSSPALSESSSSSLLSAPSPSTSKASLVSPISTPEHTCSKCSGNGSAWLVTYQLPTTFSPAVTEALVAKKLTGDRRNELTRDICASIRVHSLYPTKAEREHVAFLLIKKYPFLADSIGTVIGSWETAFKYRFKNLRKTSKIGSQKPPIKPTKEKDDEPNLPSKKRRKVEECHSIPEGETEETLKEHIKTMKKEMTCSTNRNFALVKDLMALTHGFRRQSMLKDVLPVRQIVNEYPALATSSGIKAEFSRILGKQNPVKEIAESLRLNWIKKILVYAESQAGTAKEIVASMKEAIADNTSKKNGIEEAAAVTLLPWLLKEKGGKPEDIIKICMEEESFDKFVEETTFPRIIGSGVFWSLDPLCIAAEGEELIMLGAGTSMANALGLLLSMYYVFDLAYPAKASNVYLFCEMLIGIEQDAKKRIAINKFISAL